MPVSTPLPHIQAARQALERVLAGGTAQRPAVSPMPSTPPSIAPASVRPPIQQAAPKSLPTAPYRGAPVSAAGSGYATTAPYSNTPIQGTTYRSPLNWSSQPSSAAQQAYNYKPPSTTTAAATQSTIPNAAKAAAAAAGGMGTAGGIAGIGVGALAAPAAAIAAAAAGAALLGQNVPPAQKKANWDALPASYKKAAAQQGLVTAYEMPDGSIYYAPPGVAPPLPQLANSLGAGAAAPLALLAEMVAGGAIPSSTVTADGDPPFTGGQEPGVIYKLEVTRSGLRKRCSNDSIVFDYSNAGAIYGYLPGPVSLDDSSEEKDSCNGTKTSLVSKRWKSGTTSGTYGAQISVSSSEYIENGTLSVSISRNDGLPDTYGDPPPEKIEVPATTSPPVRPTALAAAPRMGPQLAPAPIAPRQPGIQSSPKPLPEPTPSNAAPAPSPASLPAGHPLLAPTATPEAAPYPQIQPVINADGSPTGATASDATAETVPAPLSWSAKLPEGTIEYNQTPDGYQIKLPGTNWSVPQGIPKTQAQTETTTSLTTNIKTGTEPGTNTPVKQSPFPSVIPPLIMPALSTAGEKVKDPTTPGQFTTPNPPKPAPYIPPAPTGCGCNGPIIQGQQAIQAQQVATNEKLNDLANNPQSGNAAILAAIAELRQFVGTMQQFAETAWKATKMQKVLDVLTFIGVMHNVTMLSRDVAETFGYVLSQALDIIGVDNEDGSPLDINQIVGDTATNYIKSVLGEELYDDLVENYRKANRIVQVGSSIIWTIRSMQDAAQDLMEWIGENTGKIGNALKKYGVVGERAYPWMSENPQTQDRIRRRFKRVYDGIEQLDDTASSYAQVTGNVLEIQEEFTQFQQQTNDFKAAVTDLAPQERPDNVPVSDAETAAKEASLAPDIPVSDAQQGV